MLDAVIEFKDITKYDLESYLNDFISFMQNDEPIISEYYKNYEIPLPVNSFTQLNYLISENKKIQEILRLNKNLFTKADIWEVVDNIDTINIKLETITKYNKWFRTSKTASRYSGSVDFTFIQKQNQTIEEISKISGSLDSNNEWTSLAIKNNLAEDDYTLNGGVIFKFSFQNNLSIQLNSVVDVITGENIYGKDLDKKITLEDNDLKVLSPKDTIEQAFLIILGLIKGSVPEFPDDGVDKSILSNINKSFSMFPSLFRQLYNTISKDDTFKSFSLIDISKKEDSIKITVSAETRLGETLTTEV